MNAKKLKWARRVARDLAKNLNKRVNPRNGRIEHSPDSYKAILNQLKKTDISAQAIVDIVRANSSAATTSQSGAND